MEDLKQTRKKIYIRSGLFFAFLCGALLAPSILSFQYKRRANLSQLQDGLTTCFTRLRNSYTATFLKQYSSNYLGSSFFRMTEDCFAESKVLVENSIGGEIFGTKVSLNQWLNDVHLFHKNLSSRSKLRDARHLKLVDKRFSTIEEKLDGVFDLSTQELESSEDWPFVLSITWLVMLGSLIAVAVQSWKLLRNKIEGAHKAEFNAHAGRHEGQFLEGNEAKEIILNGLKSAGLIECAQLFESFYSTGKRNTRVKEIAAPEQVDLIDHQEVIYSAQLMTEHGFNEEVEAKINSSWEKDEVVEVVDERNNVGQIVEDVIDRLATELLLKRIRVAYDSLNDVKTEIGKDELEQIVFQAGILGIKACNEEKSCLSFSGSLKEEDLKLIIRAENAARPAPNEIEYQILDELVGKLGGKFDCRYIADNDVYEIAIDFSKEKEAAPEKEKKRLISLKRGRKKDLAKELQA